MASEPPERSPRESSPSRRDGPEPNLTVLAGAGLEFAATVTVLVLLGWWLDRILSTSPWLLLAGLGTGLVGGMYKLWKIGKRFFH